MSLAAKKKMSDALDVLLKTTSISKVKISDIVKISGVSRQTFYNNFHDIYDLLYWSHCNRNDQYIERFWEEEDFRHSFYGTLQMMRERKPFYQQAIRKEGQNSFRQTFTQSNFQLSKKRIKMVSGCEPTSEEEFLLELYWSGAGQMLADWIINGMKEEPRVLAQMFYDGLPLPLRKYWVK